VLAVGRPLLADDFGVVRCNNVPLIF
jgi:hypothetical protein